MRYNHHHRRCGRRYHYPLYIDIIPTIFLLCLRLSPCESLATREVIPHSTIQKRTALLSSSSSSSSLRLSSKHAIYDGSEWRSIQEYYLRQQKREDDKEGVSGASSSSLFGHMHVTAGSIIDGITSEEKRVVGVVCHDGEKKMVDGNNGEEVVALEDNVYIYRESMACIPNSISDDDAMTTCIASLASVYCAAPRIEGVGGDNDNVMVSGKVVVVGGNDYACFAAEGLASLGCSVHLISTGSPKVKNKNVNILPPAVGETEQGFCHAVGQFDTLLDTMDDERPKMTKGKKVFSYPELFRNSRTLQLLGKRHNCTRYLSTVTDAQAIVVDSGVLFGPGKANNHMKDILQRKSKKILSSGGGSDSSLVFQDIVPPKSFGTTVQTLLENGVLYHGSSYKNGGTNNQFVLRGWSLPEFWEVSTWPGDSTSDKRFGFPVKEEKDSDGYANLIQQLKRGDTSLVNIDDDGDNEEYYDGGTRSRSNKEDRTVSSPSATEEEDPYVMDVVGIEGLLTNIVYPERDTLLFLSAPFCRTCRSLSPKYSRMARLQRERDDTTTTGNTIVFAKADASGKIGKQLGRFLETRSVPAFVLFRKGKRFGSTLSIAKLPSEKLNVALDWLQSGVDWDTDALLEVEQD